MESESTPFDQYPIENPELFAIRKIINTREHNAPEFIRLTGLKKCAYCELDLSCFNNWVNVQLDHVIPKHMYFELSKVPNFPSAWIVSYANMVLACSACNGFCNRNKQTIPLDGEIDKRKFMSLVKEVFLERKKNIYQKRIHAELFFINKVLPQMRD